MRKLLIVFSGILAAAVSQQLVDEFKAWTPWLTRTLVMIAARTAPRSAKERCTEEWLSHLEEIPGQIGKILAAVGFISAGWWIQLESRNWKERATKTLNNVRDQALMYTFIASIVVRTWLRRVLVWTGVLREKPTAISPELNQAILVVLLIAVIALCQKSLFPKFPPESPAT
jgi:hypothetical protein